MARRAIKGINWAGLAELTNEADKPIFTAFKAKSELFMRRMNAHPEQRPKIDWDFYKKNISIPNFVENYQKQYEALSIPYPADKYTSQIDAEEKEMAVKIENFKKEADESISMLQAEITKLSNSLPETEMTLEEFFIAHPECAVNVDQPSCWPHDDPEAQPDHPVNFEKAEH